MYVSFVCYVCMCVMYLCVCNVRTYLCMYFVDDMYVTRVCMYVRHGMYVVYVRYVCVQMHGVYACMLRVQVMCV